MKTPSTDLFELVKSLGTQEKVFFKVNSKKKKQGNNYLHLVEEIEKMKYYDEILLKNRLRKGFPIRHLKQVKSYAIDAILKSLQEYYSEGSERAIISAKTEQARILIEKRLLKLARKVIAEALDKAIEAEEFYFIGILYSMKRLSHLMEGDPKKLNEFIKEDRPKEEYNTSQINNLTTYNFLEAIVIKDSYMRLGSSASSSLELKSIQDHSFVKNKRHANSIQSQIKLANIIGTSAFQNKEFKRSYQALKNGVTMMERSPSALKSFPAAYLHLLSNLLVTEIVREKPESVDALFIKTREFVLTVPTKQKSERFQYNYYTFYNHYISFLIHQKKYDKVLQSITEFETFKSDLMPGQSQAIFHYNLFLAQFHTRNFRMALRSINQLLKMQNTGLLEDLVEDCRLWNILIHYELGNHELIPGLCRSAKRFFKKRRHLNAERKILLNHFERFIHSSTQNETKFFKELQILLAGKFKLVIPDCFDLHEWINHKLENSK